MTAIISAYKGRKCVVKEPVINTGSFNVRDISIPSSQLNSIINLDQLQSDIRNRNRQQRISTRNPIRRVEVSVDPITNQPLLADRTLNLQKASGIELNLSARSSNIVLDVRSDPPGFWNVSGETISLWSELR